MRKGNTGVPVLKDCLMKYTQRIHETRRAEKCDEATGREAMELGTTLALIGEKRTAAPAERRSRGWRRRT